MLGHRLHRLVFAGAKGNALPIRKHEPLMTANFPDDVLSHFGVRQRVCYILRQQPCMFINFNPLGAGVQARHWCPVCGRCPQSYTTASRCRAGNYGASFGGRLGRKPEPTSRGSHLGEPEGPATQPLAFCFSTEHAQPDMRVGSNGRKLGGYAPFMKNEDSALPVVRTVGYARRRRKTRAISIRLTEHPFRQYIVLSCSHSFGIHSKISSFAGSAAGVLTSQLADRIGD
jgi:hypothetical protein